MCDQKAITASGKNFTACIPYDFIKIAGGYTKVYVWPAKIEVQGGYLTRFDLAGKIGYTFTPSGCDESSNLLNFVTKNGYNYSGCFKFTVNAKGDKEYIYPSKILVQYGYLRKVPDTSMRAGWNYYYEAENAKKTSEDKGDKEKSSGPGQIIEGVDNSVLAIAGIGLFLMLN
ncbi:MAG: hypothetical protein RL621_1890 [Bacteroidota bacterium]|jgi:hypothetical protein